VAAQDFMTCDGYDPPKSKGDGMTTNAVLWGLATGNADMRQVRMALGGGGAAACDKALADPRLLPAFQLRRGHLLQAKALHQIADGHREEALATLAESDAAGGGVDGSGFRDSIVVGNHAVRAFALIDLGRRAEAVTEIEAIEAARPYAPSSLALANRLRLRLDNSLTAHLALLRQRAVRDPSALINYFIIALSSEKFAEVAAVGGSLTFDLPSSRGGWTVQGDDSLRYELIADRAEIAGAFAYALVVTGKPERAAAVIARAREELTEAMVPPPPPDPAHMPSKSQSRATASDYEQRSAQGNNGIAALALWSRAIEIRRKAAGQTPSELLTTIQTLPRGRLPIIADLLRQMKSLGPADDAKRGEVIGQIAAATDRSRLAELKLDLASLGTLLPRPESPAMQPRFHHAGDGLFLSENGFSRHQLADANNWTVRYTHNLASKATVEELAMLSAAMLARQQGCDGVVIQSRRTVERTVHMVSRYGSSDDIPSGNEAQMNVLLVKGGVLPEEFRDAGWRVLNAEAIISDLSGRYPTTPAKGK
jgi:hypothetical protein